MSGYKYKIIATKILSNGKTEVITQAFSNDLSAMAFMQNLEHDGYAVRSEVEEDYCHDEKKANRLAAVCVFSLFLTLLCIYVLAS